MYVNYGDVNFFENGILVDTEHSDTEISILYCKPFYSEEEQDERYIFADCTVDVEDSWIDKKAVMEFIGMTEENFDNIQFAIGCLEYYGVENFSNLYDNHVYIEKKEIKKRLKHYMIASDNLDITW